MPVAIQSSSLTRAEHQIGQVLCLLYCVYRKLLCPRGTGYYDSTNTVQLELQRLTSSNSTEEKCKKKTKQNKRGQQTETKYVTTANSSKSKQ